METKTNTLNILKTQSEKRIRLKLPNSQTWFWKCPRATQGHLNWMITWTLKRRFWIIACKLSLEDLRFIKRPSESNPSVSSTWHKLLAEMTFPILNHWSEVAWDRSLDTVVMSKNISSIRTIGINLQIIQLKNPEIHKTPSQPLDIHDCDKHMNHYRYFF